MAMVTFEVGRLLLLFLGLLFLATADPSVDTSAQVCVVGAGIGGSSFAYFLKQYSCSSTKSPCPTEIHLFERRSIVGGRTATVTIAGDIFEAGASIIHPKNFHAVRFASLLGLRSKSKSSEFKPDRNASDFSTSSSWFGIWDGSSFLFKTIPPPPASSSAIYRKIHSFFNAILIFSRYGLSLLRMNRFVNKMLQSFLLYYKGLDSRPVFDSVEEMLKWSGLYGITLRTLKEELLDAGMSSLLISELVTVITRINYGQDINISGLAGAVSLAGSDDGLWSVDGGNWQLAAGLINYSNVTLHLNEEVTSVSYVEGQNYALSTKEGLQYHCAVTVFATPLDELNITFTPPVSIPSRRLQHTFTTFVRGFLNPKYFGLTHASEVPNLIGTVEASAVPFSSISVLRKYGKEDMVYKIFSRKIMHDSLLDEIFSMRKETVRIDWPAYPHFKAPEVFSPIILDEKHLYYINSFENAASTIETSIVAAENVARLVISRLSDEHQKNANKKFNAADGDLLHLDL
ncbi:farnesylcysteine lyase [Phalaenopsis equestris]|uniref:farnesylcysteine lyase n=2 Tax=Phalaenopsis equestris TaxID=78828 RepID=UPI0009E2A0B2|nr:farnesylcysteine lyase [Phalaenopsis equestris]